MTAVSTETEAPRSEVVHPIPANDYWQSRPWFSSRESFNWMLKHHRQTFLDHGSLCRIGRRLFIHSSRADAAVFEIGRKRAEAVVQEPA